MSSRRLESTEFRPRLCHLRRWPDFPGYGFNLHCEKAKPGQFIGKVDGNSPAESAGVLENDRIIEVNFVPIGAENHKQVVQRIKEGVSRDGTKYPDEVILLLVDPKTDEYYKNKAMLIKSSDPNVQKLQTQSQNTKVARSDTSGTDEDQEGNSSNVQQQQQQQPSRMKPSESNRDYKHVTDFTRPTVIQTSKADSSEPSKSYDEDYENAEKNNVYTKLNQPSSNIEKYSYKSQPAPPPSSSPRTNGSGGLLNLPMSAAEYRAKLISQSPRKRDPRTSNHMSMQQKHDLIDRL